MARVKSDCSVDTFNTECPLKNHLLPSSLAYCSEYENDETYEDNLVNQLQQRLTGTPQIRIRRTLVAIANKIAAECCDRRFHHKLQLDLAFTYNVDLVVINGITECGSALFKVPLFGAARHVHEG